MLPITRCEYPGFRFCLPAKVRQNLACQRDKFPLKWRGVLAKMPVRFGGNQAAKRAATINS
jgi:hypothetical protein